MALPAECPSQLGLGHLSKVNRSLVNGHQGFRQARYAGLHLGNLNAWREKRMISGNVSAPKHAPMAKASRRSTSSRPGGGRVA